MSKTVTLQDRIIALADKLDAKVNTYEVELIHRTHVNAEPQTKMMTMADAYRMSMGITSFKDQKNGAWKDGNIMMEGPFDHSSGSAPTERFMQIIMHPFKLAVLARFTTIGWRIVYEFAQDCWNNGLGITLLGEAVEDRQQSINILLEERFRELKFYEVWELATGFAREQGDSLILCYYEGESAGYSQIEQGNQRRLISPSPNDFNFLRTKAPNRQIVKIEAFNKQQYHVSKDDGQGNPLEYRISVFLGAKSGHQQFHVHRSRVIPIVRANVDRDHNGHPITVPCYNELVIGTVILKAIGEVAFRWSYGHPVILTKGLNEENLAKFKTLIGNPTREAWHVLPSEWVESFELISQKMGMIDLDRFGDYVINLIVASTGIPRPILMGEVAGVVTGGEVNERSYYALLDKEHSNLEPSVLEFFRKDKFIRKLLEGLRFEFDWGIRFSLSANEQIDYETKEVANNVTKLQYLPINQILHEQGYPKLEEMVDPRYKEYANAMGSSLANFTVFDLKALENDIQLAKQQAQQKAELGKDPTVKGNAGKGKGAGKSWGKGANAQPSGPKTSQSAKSNAIAQVKNRMGKITASFRDCSDFRSIDKLCKELGIARDTFYKIEAWGSELCLPS